MPTCLFDGHAAYWQNHLFKSYSKGDAFWSIWEIIHKPYICGNGIHHICLHNRADEHTWAHPLCPFKKTPSWPARACKENKRSWYIFSFSIIPSSYIGTSTTSSIHLRFWSAVFTSYIMAIRTGHKPPPFIKPLHLPFGFRSSHKTLWLRQVRHCGLFSWSLITHVTVKTLPVIVTNMGKSKWIGLANLKKNRRVNLGKTKYGCFQK